MTPGTVEQFSPPVFDFLWERLNIGEIPYPLQVPSHGASLAERAQLRRDIEAELKAEGHLDASGHVEPELERWLTVLSRPVLSADSIHITQQSDSGRMPIRGLVATDSEVAVLAAQDANAVWLRPIYPDALASELVTLLPSSRRGTHRSITMSLDEALHTEPARIKVPAHRADEQSEDRGLGRFSSRGTARPRKRLSERMSGGAKEDYALLAAEPRLCGGQLGANGRDVTGMRRRAPVLAWFDTPSGRYLSVTAEGQDGRSWVTISGADNATLRTRLAEMLDTVAEPS